MRVKNFSVLLTAIMVCCTAFFTKADQVEIRKTTKEGKVRSILLDISNLSVDLNKNVIHVDFIFLLRDVSLSIVRSDGKQVYQQVVSSQTPSIDIDLSGEEPGGYTIYFTDATGVCLYGEFVIQ